ncbi:MAG: hypothetical protein M1820_001967 [Bogoriella megaspora]|nr:MAG: hypothetical protein M1820_001967 [Bogoriella megaspora]
MPPKRMTANQARAPRYFAGKPTAPEPSSSEESSEDEESQTTQKQDLRKAPPPKATSFKPPSVTLAERQKLVREQAAKREEEKKRRAEQEEGFETEEEEEEKKDDSGSGSGSEESGSSSEEEEESSEEEEESSSEDEAAARRRMLRPVFKSKNERTNSKPTNGTRDSTSVAPLLAASSTPALKEPDERKKKADVVIQAQLDQRAAEKAAGRKQWDDDDIAAGVADLDVDDTDDVDPEAEYAAWKLRELQRVKRARDKVEQAEREREEVERRKALTDAERQEEDRERQERIKEERERERETRVTKSDEKGGLQRYHHKGAFYMDDAEKLGIARRDVMGARFEDEIKGKEALPQYLQVRDATKIGKKGRTRYRDLKSEDTGRWGDYADSRRKRDGAVFTGGDDRFRPDYGRDRDRRDERTGANAGPLGERKRVPERDNERRGDKRARVE